MFFGFFLVWNFPHLVSTHWMVGGLCVVGVAIGCFVAVVPFILDYRAAEKVLEINAVGAVAEKIENLEQFMQKISAVTDQWHVVHDSVAESAEKTALSAKQISEKMANEVREFSEFMKKMNDSEKSALRLEVEKSRRGEGEWVQTLVRILDHVFALHVAAVRSNQPRVAEQISQFQNTCRGAVHRLGLVSFIGEPNEPLNAERHQVVGANGKPANGGVIAETIGQGYTFQGKLIRPALVRLRETTPAAPVATIPPVATTPAPAEETHVLDEDEEQEDLELKAD